MKPCILRRSLPPRVPQYRPSAARHFIAWFIGVCGWRLVGEFPDVPRAVLIAAPHSSWWDGFWGLVVKFAVGIDISFMAKRELFVGPLGWLLRWLGGIPIERSATRGVVEQMAKRLRDQPQMWIGMSPEGTRKLVTRWRTGFWHIARAAKVPIVLVYFHYPERTIGIGPVFETSDDVNADMQRLREFYLPWQGKNHGIG